MKDSILIQTSTQNTCFDSIVYDLSIEPYKQILSFACYCCSDGFNTKSKSYVLAIYVESNADIADINLKNAFIFGVSTIP